MNTYSGALIMPEKTFKNKFTELQDNESDNIRFLFLCNNNLSSTLKVARFKGTDTISEPYRFEITLTSTDPDIDGNALINQRATLFIRRENGMYPYSGIITTFRYIETTVDYSTYNVTLEPSLTLLRMNTQSRIFLKKSVPDIINQVFKEAGLEWYFHLDVLTYPQREYVVQYQETDFNFISRLMEESGIWYFFSEQPQQKPTLGIEEMIITDKAANFREIADDSVVQYRSISGTTNFIDSKETEYISSIKSEQHLIPENITVKNYNYRTPEIDLSLDKKVKDGTVGKCYKYGGSFKNTTEAQKTVELIARQFTIRKTTFSGEGIFSGFRAGKTFTLEGHNRKAINTTHLITTVKHTGTDQSFLCKKEHPSYYNTFTCILSEQAIHYAPELKAPVPTIPGIMTATIEAGNSEYADIDDKGRYKVRLPFDRSDRKNANGSKYVRLAQPYSGTDYGIHFPSHEGTEMIIGHIDGDPDKPLGLGTVPNANTISPVREMNKTKSIIRTATGNEIVLEDTAGSESISLYTPKYLNLAAGNDQKLKIGNNREKTVTANETIVIGGEQSITVEGSSENIIKQNYSLDVVNGTMTTHVAGSVSETCDSDRTTTVKEAVMLESENSEITIAAATDITLVCGESMLKLSRNGTILLEGVDITVKSASGTVAIESVDTEVRASNSVTTEATTIESSAGASHNIRGATVCSEGSSLNVVKGAMVHLNPPA